MLKIAIIGCGKIADSHASQIARIAGCRIVAACDLEELMARQFAERFAVEQYFADVGQMLRTVRPDVVHITTSPQSHFALACQCLDAGSHVYVEKPFTLYTAEAEQLFALANEKGRKITVGHDDQFSHAARRLRQAVNDGYLGGPPVHMESLYCYDLTEPGYAKALLGDKTHWVRRLPGGLLHNVISHGIARLAEWFTTDQPRVIAHGFVSPMLRRLNETEIIDELRVILQEENRLTAYFTFSSQMRPSLHAFRLYGPKNGIMLDEDQQTVVRLPGSRLKSYAEKFVAPAMLAAEYLRNVKSNAGRFIQRDFHMKSGMKYLIESFYRSITDNTPLPIPQREILLTSQIMDGIFQQIKDGSARASLIQSPVSSVLTDKTTVNG